MRSFTLSPAIEFRDDDDDDDDDSQETNCCFWNKLSSWLQNFLRVNLVLDVVGCILC